MNYFERLVRRALLEPAERPGVALSDPFENTADWPLDVTAPRVSPPQPIADRATPEATTMIHPRETARTVDGAPSTAESSLSMPQPVMPVVLPAPVVTHEDTIGLASFGSVDQVEPLAQADAFLRGLGVRVPDPGIRTEVAPSAPPVPSALRRDDGEPLRTSRPPVLMPPPPPTIAVVDAARMRVVDDPAPHPESRPDLPIESSAKAPITTRETIVIDRRSVDRQTSTRPSGVGAPHVGLGQL